MADLASDVGVDALRYFFVSRSLDTQMDFDIDLATKQTNENPVYYIQYAHARICSILENKNLEKVYNQTVKKASEQALYRQANIHWLKIYGVIIFYVLEAEPK